MVGLVVFGEEAFTQCPLTLDHPVLIDLLGDIEIGIAGDRTAIGSGLGTAVKRLQKSKAKSKVVVLLTDGRNNAGTLAPATAAELAKSQNVKVYTIGAGTRGRAPFLVDSMFGSRVVYQDVEIDDDGLRSIAETTGGAYYRAEDREALRGIYARDRPAGADRDHHQVVRRVQGPLSVARDRRARAVAGRGDAARYPAAGAAMRASRERCDRARRAARRLVATLVVDARARRLRRAHRRAPRAVGVVAAAGARGLLSAELPCARGAAAPVRRAVDDRAADRRRGRAPRRDQGASGDDRGRRAAGRAGAAAGGLHLGGGRAARRRHRDRARRLQQHAGRGRRPRAAAAGARQARDPRPAADDGRRSRRHRGVRRHRVRAVSDDARLRRGRALPRRARFRIDPGAGHRPGAGARGLAGRASAAAPPDRERSSSSPTARTTPGARSRWRSRWRPRACASSRSASAARRARRSRPRAADSGAIASGAIILSRLDEPTLQQIALATDGRYVRSVTGDLDLEQIYVDGIKASLEEREIEAHRRQRWEDRFQWLLGLALAALMIDGLLADAAGCAAGARADAQLTPAARPPPPRWRWRCSPPARRGRKDRRQQESRRRRRPRGPRRSRQQSRRSSFDTPEEAYEAGEYAQALDGFLDLQVERPQDAAVMMNVGSSHYRLGDLEAAARSFEGAGAAGDDRLRAQAWYDLGNVAYRAEPVRGGDRRLPRSLDLDPDGRGRQVQPRGRARGARAPTATAAAATATATAAATGRDQQQQHGGRGAGPARSGDDQTSRTQSDAQQRRTRRSRSSARSEQQGANQEQDEPAAAAERAEGSRRSQRSRRGAARRRRNRSDSRPRRSDSSTRSRKGVRGGSVPPGRHRDQEKDW